MIKFSAAFSSQAFSFAPPAPKTANTCFWAGSFIVGALNCMVMPCLRTNCTAGTDPPPPSRRSVVSAMARTSTSTACSRAEASGRGCGSPCTATLREKALALDVRVTPSTASSSGSIWRSTARSCASKGCWHRLRPMRWAVPGTRTSSLLLPYCKKWLSIPSGCIRCSVRSRDDSATPLRLLLPGLAPLSWSSMRTGTTSDGPAPVHTGSQRAGKASGPTCGPLAQYTARCGIAIRSASAASFCCASLSAPCTGLVTFNLPLTSSQRAKA